jgi:predicted ATP-grasp superfamily ATP-dependent carboligase
MTITTTSEVDVNERDPSLKLRGGTVIDGFPGLGLAGAISSACLVESLKLVFSGELRSDLFPALATVYAGSPRGPVRIYTDANRRIAVFQGDFAPDTESAHKIARASCYLREQTFKGAKVISKGDAIMTKKQKAMESTWNEKSLDAYESWLAKQPVKEVKGKSGFIGAQEIESSR